MALKFGTKAGNLICLKKKIRTANIVEMVVFNIAEWQTKKNRILDQIISRFCHRPLIVRSSCLGEDLLEGSSAGKFDTFQNVAITELELIIEKVITSYGDFKLTDEVLVQPMLENVVMSGVAFSHDPATRSPYRLINWCSGPDTTLVTGGRGGNLFQIAASAPVTQAPKFSKVLCLVNELLSLYSDIPLDCEFAITEEENKSKLWLLQVRPLILPFTPETDQEQWERLVAIRDQLRKNFKPKPFLLGKTTIFGVMPDWNPAEIIGTRPRPLALSLYRELFTDVIWADQRVNYGYRDLRSHCIMKIFSGLPYIDVRVSFNSFIPKDLDDRLGNILVEYYLNELTTKPNLHDKIEFEVVWSCFTFDLSEQLKKLSGIGLSSDDQSKIFKSLTDLTKSILNPSSGLLIQDIEKLNNLKVRYSEIMHSKLSKIDKVYWLLEDAKRYGALPFAGLARAGFIAVQILTSLVRVGILSTMDYQKFMTSIATVSTRMERDFCNLEKEKFLGLYGHLRPGTYDINSPRYDEKPDQYFDWIKSKARPAFTDEFSLNADQRKKIDHRLKENSIDIDAAQLFSFIKSAIEYRELAKFEFTRNLSDALVLIEQIGKEISLSKDDMSYCDISSLREMHVSFSNDKSYLLRSSNNGKERYAETSKISLPPLIIKPEHSFAFSWPESQPNFITQKEVTAPTVDINERKLLKNAIVCIPNADPGFDWLFSYSIAGLITAWGGSNSHMAIRANEKGLPAVIGAGRLLFDRWSRANRIRLDCLGRTVDIL